MFSHPQLPLVALVLSLSLTLGLAGCSEQPVRTTAAETKASATPIPLATNPQPREVAPGLAAHRYKRIKARQAYQEKLRVQAVAARAALLAAQLAAQLKANPLAGRAWGVYLGRADQAYGPYAASGGSRRALLAKILLRPRAQWFGGWISDGAIAGRVRDYIATAQGGDRNKLVQLAVFRSKPWEHSACGRLPSGAEQSSYKRWIDNFAGAVGSAHTAIILQPDGPFALCVPGGVGIPSDLIGYASRKFSALPNTSVYIDAGEADWPADGRQGGAGAAVKFLLPAGIKYARGIALNSTHYSATSDEIRRGSAIVEALAAKGIRDKHVVINTSSNGRGFPFGDYRGGDPDNARVCRSRSDSGCVTLGIPPTTDVSNRKWGLSSETAALARKNVDAYLWFGRPWLYRQNDPFDMGRATGLASSTPY